MSLFDHRLAKTVAAFNDFVFSPQKAGTNPDIRWEYNHSMRVMRNALDICSVALSLKPGSDLVSVIAAAALLHDIGRLAEYLYPEQFPADPARLHGRVGADVLAEWRDRLLEEYGDEEAADIIFAVSVHDMPDPRQEILVSAEQSPDPLERTLTAFVVGDADILDNYCHLYDTECMERFVGGGKIFFDLSVSRVSTDLWDRYAPVDRTRREWFPIVFDPERIQTLGDAVLCTLALPDRAIFRETFMLCMESERRRELAELLDHKDMHTMEILETIETIFNGIPCHPTHILKEEKHETEG